MVGLHRVGGAAARQGADGRGIPEELGKRGIGDDLDGAVAGVDLNDGAAAGTDVADDVAHVLFRSGDFHLHDRFEEAEAALARGFLQPHGSGDLERHFRGVDRVERAVDDIHMEIGERVACEHAGGRGFADALFDRLDEFLRDGAADDLVFDRDVMNSFGMAPPTTLFSIVMPWPRSIGVTFSTQ